MTPKYLVINKIQALTLQLQVWYAMGLLYLPFVS